jgi:hypothetical protein
MSALPWVPKSLSNLQRADFQVLPPGQFVAGLMKLLVVTSADGQLYRNRTHRSHDYECRSASCRGYPDHDRPGPSEAGKQRDREIAGEVVELPTERRAGRPIGGAQRDEHDQNHGCNAAKFCHGFDCHSVRSICSIIKDRTARIWP